MLVCPPDARPTASQGRSRTIPANATLVFVIDVLGVGLSDEERS